MKMLGLFFILLGGVGVMEILSHHIGFLDGPATKDQIIVLLGLIIFFKND